MSSENSLPLANLKTIHLEDLRRGSIGEKEKIFAAAQDDGIFYLDFTEDHGEHRISDLIQNIYSLSQSLFDLDLDEKMQYDVDQISKLKLNGYKPISRNIGGIKGQRDGFESYAIPRNGILGFNPFIHPRLLDNHIHLLQNFLLTCIGISQNIFEALSSPLSLPTSHSLDKFHRPDAPAPDILRLLKYAASSKGDQEFRVPQTPHTDLGSLTMLFADSPGLQIKPDGCDDWLYIEPKENHAVINLGDAMSLWSGGRYRSVLHRVASLPGVGMGERYSFAFLMRPENLAPMVSLADGLPGLDGGVLTSEEWIRAKFGVLRGRLRRIGLIY
ncbi:hypothetical protein N7499_008674 [Penicillium canescens]|uniref:uncharacterized protein n=1 Tax=Penicillium canescens TaxID=5083 RepID=UPI0026DEA5BF|nr:uncharacterized protein N7446_013681 [Penicillium canescens]KAJ5985073.1 hypothetical protein N7522_012269 [Penicillium canescens]KAJ6025407.1 hypothetical protein N7444_013086 [Penicillium canescens]KAJ6042615.1 hypothetical protein N7446_013681 [Penicillium canescens]KAJ6076693.1 hypothetical protein N7499_008674 [Penicillium canescens]